MSKRRVFGVSLEKTLASEERQPDDVPVFVEAAISFLEANLNGGSLAGVFESVADKVEVDKLYQKVSQKKAYANLADAKYSAAAIASVLRTLFATISEPCVPAAVHQEFVDADALRATSARTAAFAISVHHLPPSPRALLQRTVDLLAPACEHERLAVIWAPLLFRDTSELFVRVTACFLQMAGPIFHGTALPAPPAAAAPPETPKALISVDFSKVSFGSESPAPVPTPKRPTKLVLPALREASAANQSEEAAAEVSHFIYQSEEVADELSHFGNGHEEVRVFRMPNLGTPGSHSSSPSPVVYHSSAMHKPETASDYGTSRRDDTPCPAICTATALELQLGASEPSPGVDNIGHTMFAFNPLEANAESDLTDDSSEVSFGSMDDVCGDLGLEVETNEGSPSLIVQGCLSNMPKCLKEDVATALANRLQQTPR